MAPPFGRYLVLHQFIINVLHHVFEYAKELHNHIPVHIYGKCGDMTCQPKNSSQCKNLLNGYNFYLAAGNFLCPDFSLKSSIAHWKKMSFVVVYGVADFTHYAPPHSFIKVADFKIPKQLTKYQNKYQMDKLLWCEIIHLYPTIIPVFHIFRCVR